MSISVLLAFIDAIMKFLCAILLNVSSVKAVTRLSNDKSGLEGGYVTH